jgi:hypothetical protein
MKQDEKTAFGSQNSGFRSFFFDMITGFSGLCGDRALGRHYRFDAVLIGVDPCQRRFLNEYRMSNKEWRMLKWRLAGKWLSWGLDWI